ncbi:MAG: hypothetical protein U1E10_15075 [Bdellovibrionales bacterium]|nr:hypothetical protein [Bdellovibrionales bacterium]
MGILATLLGLFGFTSALAKPPAVPQMCEKITLQDYNRSLDKSRSQSKNPFAAKDPVVTFNFDSEVKLSNDAVLVIQSNKVNGVVFHGSFKSVIELKVSKPLRENGSFDTLTFFLMSKKDLVTCRWLNEEGFDYWNAPQKVRIKFLREGEFDKNRLFRQFDVKKID